jgi:uncharacterized protein YjbI with pentapeptide repeats
MVRKTKKLGALDSEPDSAAKSISDPSVGGSTWPSTAASLADKAQNLDALRDAVVDAASVSTGLWFSYLFVLFYFAIAAGSVTHLDLLFENPVKLPFLNVNLPLVGFFVLAPMLFLIVHVFVLLHFVLLAEKVGVFDAQLRKQIADKATRGRIRGQLPSNIFVQFLAGPREMRSGIMGRMLRLVAQISLVAGPVALLVLLQLQFLPFHFLEVTWWNRVAVVLDLVMLWTLWPSVAEGKMTWIAWRDLRRARVAIAVAGSVAVMLVVFTLATFPGEWLNETLSTARGWKPLYELVIAGGVDPTTRRPTSLWPNSNRLVLPGLDAIDHTKYGTDDKLFAVAETLSLRARHLEEAVLFGADLRKADLTGSYLTGAQLNGAELQNAILDGAWLQQVFLNGAQLQGASLNGAHLRNAHLESAKMQGASLDRADLQDASLKLAQLQAALLSNTQLQGAQFDFAELQGASLTSANIQNASLAYAQLQAALLDSAQMQGASLIGAQLQGASLKLANLQKAIMTSTIVWRVDVRGPTKADLHSAVLDVCWMPTENVPCGLTASLSDSFKAIQQLMEDQVPKGDLQRSAVDRIQRLNPDTPLDGESEMARAWQELQGMQDSPTPPEIAQ